MKTTVILGMHRSGTSALSGLFCDLEFDLGETLMEAQQDNPDGFFENQAIVDLHDEFLAEVGSSWDDLRLIPEGIWESAMVSDFRYRLVDLLRSEFDFDRPWCIKDPRMCRLVPLWQPVWEAVGREVHYLIAARHPYEVAASLKRRNGFSIEKSLYLWLQHNLLAERDTRGCSRDFVTYESLLEPPQQGLEMLEGLVDGAEEASVHIARAFDPAKRHNSSALTARISGGMSDEALACYEALVAVTEDAAVEDDLSLRVDAALDELQTVSNLLPPEANAVREKEISADLLALQDEIEEARKHGRGLDKELADEVARQKETHESYQRELEKAKLEQEEVHEGYREQLEEVHEGYREQLEEIHEGYRQRLEESEGEREALRGRIETLIAALAESGSQIARAEESRYDIVRHRDREFARYEHRLGEIAVREEEVAENQREIALRGEIIGQREEELADRAREIRRKRKRISELEERLRKLGAYLDEVSEAAGSSLTNAPLRRLLRRRPKLKIPPPPETPALPEKAAFRDDVPPEAVVEEPLGADGLPEGGSHADSSEDSGPVPLEPSMIHLPECEEPLVSIIIPVFNNIGYTTRCLQSIAAKTDVEETPYEVIVADDQSSDATGETCRAIEGLRYHRNEENRGFGYTCNAGAAKARGKYVLFLNNDTHVTEGWLRALVETFSHFPDAGYVGSKLVYPDGSLQEAGGIIWRDGSGWNFGREMNPDAPEFNYVRDVDYASAAACILPKEIWDAVGGFSPEFEPAYYEDTDLAFKVRDAGYRVLYQPFSEVIHFEGKTSGTDLGSGVKRYQQINQPKFVERWQRALAGRPENGDIEGALRPAGGGQRILFIDDMIPMPDQSSGGVRAFNILKVLARLGHSVTFMGENPNAEERYRRPLQELGIRVLYDPHYKSLEDFLYRDRLHHCQSREFDTIVVARHMITRRYLSLFREMCPGARIVFDTVDLHYLRMDREAALTDDVVGFAGAGAAKMLEYDMMARCEQTWVVSDHEVEIIAEENPEIDVQIVSNVIDVVGTERPFSERAGIVFIGGYQHPPNIDAVIWFADEVWPLVRERLPEACFRIAGSAATPEVEALGRREGIEFLGFVESAEDLFEECRISVAPLRYGAGVKGKINQSLSLGVPVVTTAVGAEGMGLEHERDVLVGETPEELAEAVVRAYTDEGLWDWLQENGLETMRRLFSLEAMESRLREIFD